MRNHIILLLGALSLAGCSTYRVTSNIPAGTVSEQPVSGPVMLLEGEPTGERPFHELGPIEVSVRKGSPFVATPDRNEANRALRQKARDMGAEAVIRIRYESGFDVISWGHIQASGIAIRFTD